VPNLSVTVAEAGRSLGLQVPPGKSIAYGVKDGYPVQLIRGHDEGQECVTEIIRYDDGTRDGAVRDAVTRSPSLRERTITPSRVQAKGGVLVYRHHRNWFRSVRAETIVGQLDVLLSAVKLAAGPPAAACRLCGSSLGAAPVLLNGVIDRVCPACVERLQHEAKRAMARYDDQPMNLPFALLVAAGLAVVTALLWAGVVIATHRMLWLVAVGGGLLIGWGTTRAAGRGGTVVQVIGGVFTLLGVLAGQVLVIAFHVKQYASARHLTINWMDFAEAAPRLLWASGTNTLFAFAGGLLGAYYAARRAATPKLEVKVEKTGS